MYDRPNAEELIDAVRMHLEQHVIPVVRSNPRLYFQTLVAANVLKIVGRELALGESHAVREWASLNALENVDTPLPSRLTDLQAAILTRNAGLCADIRAGKYDAQPDSLLEHVKSTTIAQLEVANPRYLQTLAAEDHANHAS